MTKEEILVIARKTYPIGTEYYNTGRVGVRGNKATVQGEFMVYSDSTGPYQISDGQGGSVFFKGQWAEYVSPPKVLNYEIY